MSFNDVLKSLGSVCCAVGIICGIDSSSAMSTDVTLGADLEEKVEHVTSNVRFYEGELDPEKFITDPSIRATVRRCIAQIVFIGGDNFNTAYSISKAVFLGLSKEGERHLFNISQEEELSLIDVCIAKMKTTADVRRKAPCLYLAYTYSNRNAICMFCDRMVQFENTKVLAENLRSCLR